VTVAAHASPTYTQALSKGGSLLPETRILLTAWQPGETEEQLTEQVLGADLLGRATARRALDIVRVFALRFLTPTDATARHLKRFVAGAAPKQVFTDLVFFYTAQRDALLRDFTVQRFWPDVREGRLLITNSEVRRLILEAEQDGRISTPWSEEIKRDMAGRVLIALTDFGLVRTLKPAKREVLPYRVADSTVVYLAYLLHSQGVTDASLAEYPAWAIYGLEPADVWNRLEALAGEEWFVVQRAGQVVRITWRYDTMEEVVDALAG
jgi:hypothetical protein